MSIEQRVLNILAELASVDARELGPGDDLRSDLGLDSIRAMELLALLDDELGVDVPIDSAAGLRKVADVIELVRARSSHVP
jgi:acyl carrier protein